MDIIVDGYNLIAQDHNLGGNLEHHRNWLVQRLSRYQEIKGHRVVLVFDGWKSGWPKEVSQNHRGVRVVFSRQGEKADSVITRLARERGSGCVVVTSDREIQRTIEKHGAVAIESAEFQAIVRRLDIAASFEPQEDESRSAKKGNPRRLSRAERKRLEKLKKL